MKSFKQFLNTEVTGYLHHFNFSSSFVKSVIYNLDEKALYVVLHNKSNKEYVKKFYNVHSNTVLDFINASGKGNFYRNKIEMNYKYEVLAINWYWWFLKDVANGSLTSYNIIDIKNQYRGYMQINKLIENCSRKSKKYHSII